MPGSTDFKFLPQKYLRIGLRDHEIYNFLTPYSTDAI